MCQSCNGSSNLQITLRCFGPIEVCNITINYGFTILTGPQAAGKSTIAKSVFFFKTVKNDICDEIIKSITYKDYQPQKTIYPRLKRKFMQLFGSSYCMNKEMEMSCRYGENTNTTVQVSLSDVHSFITVNFSQDIGNYLQKDHSDRTREDILAELNALFHDDYETIFIPAGRSVITLLADHLNYMFTSMDEEQKSRIDYCTLKYVETILKIRPSFSSENNIGFRKDDEYVKSFISISGDLLKGSYRYENGEERIYLPDKKKYIKINYTSSGQQEIVWMINILFYLLKEKRKIFVIIEEPEAHLYPNAQKEISELISVFVSAGNQALITTHSPYVLGALNNSIYAYGIAKKHPEQEEKIRQILNRERRIEKCDAYFVDEGKIKSCISKDDQLIENSIIDGASQDINDCFDSLFRIEYAENSSDGDTDVSHGR